jgi:integrase/recombinase XerD
MTPLRQKMVDHMQLRRLSPSTQHSYTEAVAGLARFYNKTPDKIDNTQIQAYILHLMRDRKLAWSTCNVIVNGLRFFYTKTLGWDSVRFNIPPCKTKKQLPEILSKEELEQLFSAAANLKHRVLLMTTYSAGLRVSEVVNLQLTDIDSKRMLIRVVQSKGNKDRYVNLSENLLPELRHYWRTYHPQKWLFTSSDGKNSLSVGTAQKIYYLTKQKARIKRRGQRGTGK